MTDTDTNTSFSIQHNNNYIELQSRNAELSTITKDKLLNQIDYWKNFSHQVKKDCANANYDFPNIINWQQKLSNFIKVHESFPSIENMAALECMRSLHGFHLMPHYNKDSKPLLDYWGYNKPELKGEFKNGQLKFYKKLKKPTITPKKINNEFKIVRIKTSEQVNNETKETFIDLKVVKYNQEDFIETVLTLPEFWRNFHFITRKNKDDIINNPTSDINSSLTNFYIPNQIFTEYKRPKIAKEQLIKEIIHNNYFKLFVNDFATHLIFRQPGLILPLTQAEQEYSATQKPAMIISIIKNEQNGFHTNSISIQVPKQNFKQIFETFSSDFSKRESEFASYFDMNNYSGGQYIATQKSEIIFNYEFNMVHLFESLTRFDNQPK